MIPLVKSFELPGGLKVELRELEELEQRARGAGLLTQGAGRTEDKEFAFQQVADRDANLALAGLRIEIERRLRKIAEPWVPREKPVALGWLMRELQKKEALTKQQISVLSDLIGLLNSAVHGAEVDPKSLDWAMNIGPLLVYSLEEAEHDQRIEEL